MHVVKIKTWQRERCIIWIILLTVLILLRYSYLKYNKEEYLKLSDHSEVECEIPKLEATDDYFNYFEKTKTLCSQLEQIGGIPHGKSRILDGDKWVCFDRGFVPGDCVVYSFGISNEWSFDDAIASRGCKVFAFDPTMGQANHKRGDNIMFYNLGLGDKKETRKIGGRNSQLDSYGGILKMLNHENTKIDYLKMDIEGFEMQFFNDVLTNKSHLLDNVQQIGMEVHEGAVWKDDPPINLQNYWKHYHKLECLGFRLLTAYDNDVPVNIYEYKGKKRSQCHELVWIRT